MAIDGIRWVMKPEPTTDEMKLYSDTHCISYDEALAELKARRKLPFLQTFDQKTKSWLDVPAVFL